MTFDTQQFYNEALAIVAGIGAGALWFRLLPPLSPAFRTRRLLALTLRDLRRLAMAPTPDTPKHWEQRMYARFALLPIQAQPLQRSHLMAAFSVGSNIIQLRRLCRQFDLSPGPDTALDAIAQGNSATTIAQLAKLDCRPDPRHAHPERAPKRQNIPRQALASITSSPSMPGPT